MRLLVGSAVLMATFAVAGCGVSQESKPQAPSKDDSIRVENVQVGERTVPCILWDAPGNGGLAMSCDWTVRS